MAKQQPAMPEMKLELVPVPVADVDRGLHLVVNDIDEARQALIERGVEVDEVLDVSQVKYAAFRDPDGNTWLLQEFPPALRQPGQSFYQAENQAS